MAELRTWTREEIAAESERILMVAQLPPRELQILRYIADGIDADEMAAALFVSVSTVKIDVRRCLCRLGARSRAHAVAIAFRAGALTLEGPPPAEMPALSPRELRVLEGFAAGRSYDDLAAEMSITRSTVKSHAVQAFEKLGVHCQERAVMVAFRAGVLKMEDNA